jgi:hypothetical protein
MKHPNLSWIFKLDIDQGCYKLALNGARILAMKDDI